LSQCNFYKTIRGDVSTSASVNDDNKWNTNKSPQPIIFPKLRMETV
jgi:hypothetical protein